MKNIISIDAVNDYDCDLVSSINDGTNRLIISVKCNPSKEPFLQIGGLVIDLSESDNEIEVSKSQIYETGSFTFRVGDNDRSTEIYEVKCPESDEGELFLKQISDWDFELTSRVEHSINVDEFKELALEFLYPVGSIYMSTSDSNPSSYLGGTWTAWGSGRVPVGVDLADTDFSTVEKMGGYKDVALNENQMPSHRHGVAIHLSGREALGYGLAVSSSFVNRVMVNSLAGDCFTDNNGGGQAHTNIQPYVTCYMWKRTA